MEIKNCLKIFFLSISLFLYSFTSYAVKNDFKPQDSINPYCSGKLLQNSSKIKKLEIKVNKNRRWTTNLLNLHLNFQKEKSKSDHDNWFPNFRISDQFKKKFKGKISLKYDNKINCDFKALIRVTGDMWWHIGWAEGTPITSINIELLEGHVNNITRFKLLLPKSRYGSNEIFTATLLKHLGFLSPRTFFVKAKMNGFTNEYIFQEDLRKEFIENSSYREGPILEGDERFTISLKDSEHLYEKKTNLSKLANKSFAKKSIENSYAALESVKNLNLLYLLNHNANYPEGVQKNINLYLFTNHFFDNQKNIKLLETYDALVYAIDAAHSLSFDDRRFYFDTIDRSFIPIFYDGKSNILENKQILSDQELDNNSSIEAKRGSIEALNKINKINYNKLIEELNNAGMKINETSLKEIILKIKKRLNLIKDSNPIIVEKSNDKSYFSLFNKKETRNKKLVFSDIVKKEFHICNFNAKECETHKLNSVDYSIYLSNALNQDFETFNDQFKVSNDLIFVHSNINYENIPFKFSQYLPNWSSINIENTLIQFNKNIDIKIDESKKIILINQKNKEGLVLFKNGKLTNWLIKFNGHKLSSNKDIKKETSYLTGCLNIYDLTLEKTSFDIENTVCEDAINFINSRGSIESIKVKNSFSDSVDMDFSNLKIKKIDIRNSLNDCLDLSFGKYQIDTLIVKNCGDKGVSVGENSKLDINFLMAEKTKMAVVSKDSSFVTLKEANIKNSDICFAAYRKKQEFSGGKIVIKDYNCDKEKIYKSIDSEINFL